MPVKRRVYRDTCAIHPTDTGAGGYALRTGDARAIRAASVGSGGAGPSGTLRAACSFMMNDEDNRLAAASFDLSEEAWFARPERTRRASQRPTLPAPAVEGPIDSAIDGWFFDVATWCASGDPTG